MAPRVCIVGAGAAGIATAKTLIERGVAFDCFERAEQLGGLWSRDGHGAVYRTLHINSSKRQSAFSDYPIPASYPDFPSRAEVAAYLQGYARHFGVEERVALGRAVTDVAPGMHGGWAVTIDGHEERHYDTLLVASGHHSTPKLPVDAGIGFGGEVLHSHDVRDAAQFEGKRVLVVGFGNSAADIASLVSTTAARTYLSTRRGAHVVPKYLFGRPFDQLPAPPWPRWLQWGCYELATRLAVGSLERYGLPAPQHRFGRAAVTISSDLLGKIVHGTVAPRPGVRELHADGATFADGSEEEIDAIVYCTGYAHALPFLERYGLGPEEVCYRLYRQIWDPRFAGFAHVGLVQPLGSFFRVFEAQARLLADWIEGGYALPERLEMEDAIADAERRRARHYVSSERHVLQVDERDYTRRLERERRAGARRAARAHRVARPEPLVLPEVKVPA